MRTKVGYSQTRNGRLYNDSHAECMYSNPETHQPHALLWLSKFGSKYELSSAGVRSYCLECVSLSNKAHQLRKKTAGECADCKSPAVYGVYCEWHWFRGRAGQAQRLDKRAGIRNEVDRVSLARYIQSIYPEDGTCAYCETVMDRSGGSVKDGIKSSHQKNASLDAIHPARGHTQGNLIWVCYRCNATKSDMSIDEIRSRIGWHTKVLEIMQRSQR